MLDRNVLPNVSLVLLQLLLHSLAILLSCHTHIRHYRILPNWLQIWSQFSTGPFSEQIGSVFVAEDTVAFDWGVADIGLEVFSRAGALFTEDQIVPSVCIFKWVRAPDRLDIELVATHAGPIRHTIIIHHQGLHVSTLCGVCLIVFDTQKYFNRWTNVFNELGCGNKS